MEKKEIKIGKIGVEKLVEVLKDHLDECDLDELYHIAGEMSGAKLFCSAEGDQEVADIFIDDCGNYFGMFDKAMEKV